MQCSILTSCAVTTIVSLRTCRFRAAMALCASGYLTQHGKITSLKISKQQAVPAWISTQRWSLYTRELK